MQRHGDPKKNQDGSRAQTCDARGTGVGYAKLEIIDGYMRVTLVGTKITHRNMAGFDFRPAS